MEDASLYAEAVCVENGRILAVGNFDDVMQYKKDERSDRSSLKGKTMPAWIYRRAFSFCRGGECDNAV